MAEFSFSDFDDITDTLINVEVNCPECDKAFTISLEDEQVTCPHCGVEITIESES